VSSASPRNVRLTAGGRALVAVIALLFAGGIVAGVFCNVR
jgi:hypothetical protein